MEELICKECGNVIKNINNSYITENDEVICDVCASSKYIRCSCGRYIPETEQRYTCKACDNIVYSRFINSYSTKPSPVFKNAKGEDGKQNATRYYGMELEYSNLNATTAYILFNELYKNKWIYNKSDGSLNDGVEIVTNPMDKKSVGELLDKMKDGLHRISKIRGHKTNAGLHIHVNKKSVPLMDMYKLSYLFNRDCEFYDKAFIYFLCGRTTKSSITKKEFSDGYYKIGYVGESFKKHTEFVRNGGSYERHIAVNFYRKNTIEFRLFKSSADIPTIKSYIEFIELSLNFCHDNPINKINVPNFREYILSNSRNELILKRTKSFDDISKLEPKTNNYSLSGMFELLKGINYKRYEELRPYLLRAYSINAVGKAISDFLVGKPYYSHIKQSDKSVGGVLYSKLEHTVKSVLVNKILKEVNKCA